jgi:alpha-galactosidase/6-phospho-beta-glucosidase family protein
MRWAAIKHGGVRSLGLCHGVQHGRGLIARALGAQPGDVDVICAGINHQTWYIQVKLNGVPVEMSRILKAFEGDPRIRSHEKVRIDMMKRFGYFSTESNGHLSAGLAPRELHRIHEDILWHARRGERALNAQPQEAAGRHRRRAEALRP